MSSPPPSVKATTFSIVAQDPKTGQVGVAVATKVPAVGALCPYARHGVGALVTQAWTNPYLAPATLDAMAAGGSPQESLDEALAADPGKSWRQVGVVSCTGQVGVFTGDDTDPWHGHRCGKGFAVQGNMLTGVEVLKAMEAAFLKRPEKPLAARLLSALEAGQTAGGDRRGRQSAAVLVPGPEMYPAVDLRVDEHRDPVRELRRVYEVARRELFPSLQAMPTRANPRGDIAKLRHLLAAKD